MQKNEVIASVVMESVSTPQKPEQIKVVDRNGLYYVSFYTTLQDFNVQNRNGRIYDGNAMIQGLNEPHIKELMENGTFVGEYGHPLTDDMKRILTIDPKCICHRITSMDVTNQGAKGWVDTLADGYGRHLTNFILQGVEPAFSLRALAAVTRRGGKQIVQSKPRIVTYDCVILPSHKVAYRDKSVQVQTKQILSENANVMHDVDAIPVMESQILDLVRDKSVNVDIISDMYEVCTENMTLSSDLKNVILRENGRTFHVSLDDKLRRDITGFMSSF